MSDLITLTPVPRDVLRMLRVELRQATAGQTRIAEQRGPVETARERALCDATEAVQPVEKCWNFEGRNCPPKAACYYPMQCVPRRCGRIGNRKEGKGNGQARKFSPL